MRSNSGPSISVRTYSSASRYRAIVCGSMASAVARRVASTFCRVLLKNWYDSATCAPST